MRQQVRRAALAAGLGTLAIVGWGMVFWGFLAAPLGAFHALPNAGTVTSALQADSTATGTYFMPWPRDTPEAFATFVAQHRTGPFYRLGYVREGVDPNSPAKLALGTLHYFVVASIAVALGMISAARSFRRRFGLVLLAGLLGSVFITIGDPVWFHMPWDYVAAVLVYELVAWLLLALINARWGPHGVKADTPNRL